MTFNLLIYLVLTTSVICNTIDGPKSSLSVSLPSTDEEDKGNFFEDLFSTLFSPLAQLFGGSGKCALYEGQPGMCKGNPFNCPNLANATKTKCIYGLGQVGTCCPNEPFKEMVYLPKLTARKYKNYKIKNI